MMTTETSACQFRRLMETPIADDVVSARLSNAERVRNVVHELKIQPKYFDDVADGIKPFEVRYNDRDFKVGDLLILREWTGYIYTGRITCVEITYILNNEHYLQPGYVVLGVKGMH